MPRSRAVWATGALVFLGSQRCSSSSRTASWTSSTSGPASFGLLLFGFVEIVIFTRIFGMTKGWEEITRGAKLAFPACSAS